MESLITENKEKEIKKKTPKGGGKTNRRLTEANKEWNDWKFQIHWNKL